ncbi:MAG: hypothetical protein J0L64_02900 [Acidobacteria bacterium]|nr:hypothetical protein [Acidobacteriota bacterium]
MASAPDSSTARLPKPPAGATYFSDPVRFRVTVPSSSPQSWLVMPLFVLWVAVAVYAFVIGPKRPDDPASTTLVMVAFAALIGIPLVASVLFAQAGRLTVACEAGQGVIREHIGPFGRSQTFSWEALAAVREVEIRGRYMRGRGLELDLSRARAHRRLYFAKGLPDDTRRYLIAILLDEIAQNRHARPLGLDL